MWKWPYKIRVWLASQDLRFDTTFLDQNWRGFNLRSGINRGQYSVSELGVEIPFLVYLLDYDNKLVITDVDGTITEQDVKGRVFPTFGFKANHDGIVRLLDKVVQNGYVVVYLTGRSMGEDHDTRTYLFEVFWKWKATQIIECVSVEVTLFLFIDTG